MTSKTDTLIKPDMKAVLKRTHISNDIHGFLLPIFEAVSNSMHGIEEKYNDKNDAQNKGEINIYFKNTNSQKDIFISITDNGIGLNEENYKSFKTPFSGFKLDKKARGFGRFIAFKIFSNIQYASRYIFMGKANDRIFQFDINKDNEIIYNNNVNYIKESGLRIEYKSPLKNWHDLIKTLNQDEISDEIASHFLPHFLYGWLPEITIKFDEDNSASIRDKFASIFVQSDSGQIDCEIDGKIEIIEFSLAKIPKTRMFNNHSLLFSASDRIVGKPRDLSAKLGKPYFVDEKGEKYIIIAVVRGDLIDNRLYDARTGVDIDSKNIERIVSKISDVIESKEQEQITKIKSNQSEDLRRALSENPILRLGLRGKNLDEYVKNKPNNWTSEQFISDLAIERARASRDLNKAIASAAGDPENYIKNIKEIVNQIDRTNKEALAEYVVHRKKVIELVEEARKRDATGNHPPESLIHDLIFKKFNDNVSTDYFEHNLWIIDDVLAFMPYITSERALHGSRRVRGDKIADLSFFDDSLVLGDNDGTSITIIEFKKPSRDDYSIGKEKSDPVRQVISTIKKATKPGGVEKTDGTHFSFDKIVRKNAFIIADLKPTLISLLNDHDFKSISDPKIYYRYHENQGIFIQAFGYDTLIETAKKRNQAFFTVLLGE